MEKSLLNQAAPRQYTVTMAEIFIHNDPFTLESGITLPQYHLAYSTYGSLNRERNNVVWIFHALTANSEAAEWWPGLVGEGKLFDPAKFFIICVNMPGSCYGSFGPLDSGPVAPGLPADNSPTLYHDFPFFTTRDMVRAYIPLRKKLGISSIHIGIGGSMGGQQLLEWAVEEPGLFQYIFPIATNAFHSPWGIAFNASQRLCIETDPTWADRTPESGTKGMKAARSVALLSYRNYETYRLRQSETNTELSGGFKSDSYQRYQGEKLAKRFNAFSYYKLSQSMDSHNVGRGRGGVEQALQLVTAKTLVIGIKTDVLFPVQEQQFLGLNIPGAFYEVLYSLYGHDGFLLEFEQIAKLIVAFLTKNSNNNLPDSRLASDKLHIIN